MYGKVFATTFTGSMMGAGAHVFAVWTYALANADERGYVELNAQLLAAVIGEPKERMVEALKYLIAPDPSSRNPTDGGRRMVREGQFVYRIVNHADYRGMRDKDDRRLYQRRWTRDKRSKSLDAVERCRPASTQVEAEVEVEEDPDTAAARPGARQGTLAGIQTRGETAAFQAFYAAYPRKEKRPSAWRAWKRQKCEPAAADVMAGLARWKPEYESRPPDKVPHPATWLNDRQWNDSPPKQSRNSGTTDLDTLVRELAGTAA